MGLYIFMVWLILTFSVPCTALFDRPLSSQSWALNPELTAWPLREKHHKRNNADTVPDSPPWVFPSSIRIPPECLQPGENCPFQADYLDNCSAEKCTVSLFGGCSQWETLVDLDCVCGDLTSSTCSQCSDTRDRAEYLRWLNGTCGVLKDWNGLSKNWTAELPQSSFLWIGEAQDYDYVNEYAISDSYYETTWSDVQGPCFQHYWCRFIANYEPPWNTPWECSAFNASVFEPNLFNASEAATFAPSVPRESYSPYSDTWRPDPGLYLDRIGFCKDAYSKADSICSAQRATTLLLWASTICDLPGTFSWPSNWRETLLVQNATLVNKTTFVPPSPPGPHYCAGFVNDTILNCTVADVCRVDGYNCTGFSDAVDKRCFCSGMDLQQNCNATDIEQTELNLWLNKTCRDVPESAQLPDRWEDQLMLMNTSYLHQNNFTWPSCLETGLCFDTLNATLTDCSMYLCNLNSTAGNCSSTIYGFEPSCFCRVVDYDKHCTSNCKLSWERAQHLNWINSTCSTVSNWNGLPDGWTSLLAVQQEELLPWSWRLQISPNQSSNATASEKCPSTAGKLAVFAAVNAAMVVLVPILGRRDVMKKLTRGCCGHRGSSWWLLTGPITVILHVASNAIAAFLIKATPGYGHVDIGRLILLWCTRPRIAWMVIVLVPWQAADEIYFSVASSTLLAEVLLQVLGAYYMGVATDYARVQKFYQVNRLAETPRGKDATVMYAGSVMWLSVIFIALVTCLWSAFGLSSVLANLASSVVGLKGKSLRRRRRANAGVKTLESLQSEYTSSQRLNADCTELQRTLDQVYTDAIAATTRLSDSWGSLHTYLTDDKKMLVDTSKQLRKRRKKKQPTGEAEDAYNVAHHNWLETPSNRLGDIQAQKEIYDQLRAQATTYLIRVQSELSDSLEALDRLGGMLSEVNCKVRRLRQLIDQYRNWRKTGPQSQRRERHFVRREIGLVETQMARRQSRLVIRQRIYRDELREWEAALAAGINLETQLQQLVGVASPTGDEQTQAGLTTLIQAREDTVSEMRQIHRASKSLLAPWTRTTTDYDQLCQIWSDLEDKRMKEDEEWKKGRSARLKKIALRCIVGMFGCWAAQWLWWIGYVRVSQDDYCPPKLTQIASVWTGFSALGAILGGSM